LKVAPPEAIRSETWWESFPSDEMTMDYKVIGKTIKNSVDNLCCWCTLLVDGLRNYPRDDHGFPLETDGLPVDPGTTPERIFEVKLKFMGSPCVQPFRFNHLEVKMFGPPEPEMSSASLTFRAFVHTSKC